MGKRFFLSIYLLNNLKYPIHPRHKRLDTDETVVDVHPLEQMPGHLLILLFPILNALFDNPFVNSPTVVPDFFQGSLAQVVLVLDTQLGADQVHLVRERLPLPSGHVTHAQPVREDEGGADERPLRHDHVKLGHALTLCRSTDLKQVKTCRRMQVLNYEVAILISLITLTRYGVNFLNQAPSFTMFLKLFFT